MKTEELERSLKECFKEAEKEEKKGNKYKGLVVALPDAEFAKGYLRKARESLELCEIYKGKRFDYKIPEEWFYALYYCALAILSKFGVESRSQKYTAQFLKYVKQKGLIDYDDEFIDMIMVHKEKSKESEVDKREEARYSSATTFSEVFERYEPMASICKRAIFQAEGIVFSGKEFKVPRELIEQSNLGNSAGLLSKVEVNVVEKTIRKGRENSRKRAAVMAKEFK